MAFKEWAVIVDALGLGEQIIILRKGGISEIPGGFRPEHAQFLLFPTQYHQQRESVVPVAQIRFDQIAPHFADVSQLRLEFFAEVASVKRLDSLAAAERLRGQHIWSDQVIAQRFEWGRNKNMYALAARVFRLPQAIKLPKLPGYGGCKSWVELKADVVAAGSTPVLTDKAFAEKLNEFQEALGTQNEFLSPTGVAILVA